ncbi:MAG: nitroreductase family protein [Synergistaceae bacterium]|nr:nitroreductase family protein [Synergistaceae bacterium]
MKDFMELMATRQSCRSYDGAPVTKEEINACLDAARLAPSGCNSQPWNFVVVTNAEKRHKLSELLQCVDGNKFSENVPALIVVCEEECPRLMPAVLEKWSCKQFAQGDLGAAVVCITLRAAELGLASCIMGTFDEDEVKRLLDIPSGQTIRVVVALGHPTDGTVRPKKRKPLEEIARFVE